MSIHAINWSQKVCKTIGVPPHHRHLLLVLATFHHDKTEKCEPSYSTLASAMGYRERKVIMLMKDLERNGLVLTKPRFVGGKQSSNQYVLFGCPVAEKWVDGVPPCAPQKRPDGVHHTTPHPGENVLRLGVPPCAHNRELSVKKAQAKAVKSAGARA